MGLLTDEDESTLSPAEERALRAEKRAAWRAARLKSLEQDAIQAQMVIKSMTDIVGGATPIAESPKEEVSFFFRYVCASVCFFSSVLFCA